MPFKGRRKGGGLLRALQDLSKQRMAENSFKIFKQVYNLFSILLQVFGHHHLCTGVINLRRKSFYSPDPWQTSSPIPDLGHNMVDMLWVFLPISGSEPQRALALKSFRIRSAVPGLMVIFLTPRSPISFEPFLELSWPRDAAAGFEAAPVARRVAHSARHQRRPLLPSGLRC